MHGFAESRGLRKRYGVVFRAVEDDRGRCALFHVQQRRQGGGLFRAAEARHKTRGRRYIQDGIEQHECIGHRAYGQILAFLFLAGDRGGARGDMTARGPAARGDAIRVDAQLTGMGAEKTHG